MKRMILLMVVVCLGTHYSSFAQESKSNLGTMNIFWANAGLSPKTSFFIAHRTHTYQFENNLKFSIVRAGFDFKTGAKSSIHLGYGAVEIQPEDKSKLSSFNHQDWVLQEFHYRQKWNSLSFYHRLRSVQRWITNLDNDTHFNQWLRYRLKVKKEVIDQWSLFAMYEVYYDLSNSNFYKNRSVAGFNYTPSNDIVVCIGLANERIYATKSDKPYVFLSLGFSPKLY